MTAAPAIFKIRCHYCSHFRNPKEIIPLGTGGALMCWFCYDNHLIALKMLCGQPPPGCQGDNCGLTFAQLQAEAGSDDCKMYIHPKDGIYQVLCRACSDRYVLQRVDLYRPTRYGHRKKL